MIKAIQEFRAVEDAGEKADGSVKEYSWKAMEGSGRRWYGSMVLTILNFSLHDKHNTIRTNFVHRDQFGCSRIIIDAHSLQPHQPHQLSRALSNSPQSLRKLFSV